MIDLDDISMRRECVHEVSATTVPQDQDENSSREISNSCINRLRSNWRIILIVVLLLVLSVLMCVLKILLNTGTCSFFKEQNTQLNTELTLSLSKIEQLEEEQEQVKARLKDPEQQEEKIQKQQLVLFSSKLSFLWKFCNNETFECSRCPPGWTEHASRCFMLSNIEKNWEDARIECKKMGGDLVVIQNNDDQELLTTMTYEYKKQNPTFQAAWIGLQDMVKEKTFVWINGSKLEDDFHYWGVNQPDNISGAWDKQKRGQDCVAIQPTSGTMTYNSWDDITCVGDRHYLCESTALILF